MSELIDKIESETGFEFHFINRDVGSINSVTYNYVKKGIVSDNVKELNKYSFFFLLVIDNNITEKIEKLENALYNNNFSEIQSHKIDKLIINDNEFYQVSITGTKII